MLPTVHRRISYCRHLIVRQLGRVVLGERGPGFAYVDDFRSSGSVHTHSVLA